MNETEKRINKDLILREKLALERTEMAIDRTLLSFVRTALYFAVAGMTVDSLLKVKYGAWIEAFFWIIAVVILVTGIIKFRQQKIRLNQNRVHIGNYKSEWEDDADLM
jgi:putative membrane protein